MKQSYNIPHFYIAKYLHAATNEQYPVVSVGCGNGAIEYIVKSKGVKDIIMVDPNPESFCKYPKDGKYLPTDYSTVTDLLEARPNLVGKCVLFLCWPEQYESYYDSEAIYLLQPISIVLIYEASGIAGGETLHEWLRGIGAETRGTTSTLLYSIPPTNYFPLKNYTVRRKSPVGVVTISMVWVVRKDAKIEEKYIEGVESVRVLIGCNDDNNKMCVVV